MSVVQRRPDELIEILRGEFVGNDGRASPTFTDEYLTGSHRASVSVGVRVFRNANQLTAHGVWAAVIFDTQRWDDPDDTMWAVAPNPTRLTCQMDGIYVIAGGVAWAANAVGARAISILLNGAAWIAEQDMLSIGAIQTGHALTTIYKMVVGNFVELRVWQNSGGNLNIIGAAGIGPEFSMVRVA